MRLFTFLFLTVLLATTLMLPASSDELWVKNQPFTGQIRGTGRDMMVEVRTFLKVLKLEAEDEGDIIVVGGFPIPVLKEGNTRFIPLRDIVDAANLRLSRNAALGTVDVRSNLTGSGSRGDWSSSDGKDSTVRKKGKGSPTTITGSDFTLKVPKQLSVIVDPSYYQGEEKANTHVSSLNQYRSASGPQTVFVASTKGSSAGGTLILGLIRDVDFGYKAEEQAIFAKEIKEGFISESGGKLVHESKSVIAGKKFYRWGYTSGSSRQKKRRDLHIHINVKTQTAYVFIVAAPAKLFPRLNPQAKLAIKSLRIKSR